MSSVLGLNIATLREWYPPVTRENWRFLLTIFQWTYPILGAVQFVTTFYPMGKTSVASRLNLPGRLGWFTMEVPGFLTLLYMMRTLPAIHGIEDLPWQNKVLAGLFVIHYLYRAVAYPFLQPSISPIHPTAWQAALLFQLLNGVSLGGWLAAYGPTTAAAWEQAVPTPQFVAGVTVFYLGLAGNYFHDEELREIRRRESRRGNAAAKHYRIPQAGLFKYMLFPHYFCEWVEWFGFWMACGWGCVPALTFLINEFTTMLPRAVSGKRWYAEKFGEEKVAKKWAVIPGVW
ncbi:unnamed protein product [Clonostachys rhizophaga]|uniref:3-oxo-5-alpha-steroid 4-dehydrogenase C-terminal domain-containing protein n=1 Tax=Clonostachys rhizophaga TaxID=160324 RepID=A0A9N9V6C4_9HYPO|nr:unnamed protein product [Clonostachys rhizophaga]